MTRRGSAKGQTPALEPDPLPTLIESDMGESNVWFDETDGGGLVVPVVEGDPKTRLQSFVEERGPGRCRHQRCGWRASETHFDDLLRPPVVGGVWSD